MFLWDIDQNWRLSGSRGDEGQEKNNSKGKGDIMHHWDSECFIRARKERHLLFFLPFSSPSFLGKKSRGLVTASSLSSGSMAFWGQVGLCISFQRDNENWVGGEKLTNSFGQYSRGSPWPLECSTNLFKREISVDFGKLLSCQSGSVMRDDIK